LQDADFWKNKERAESILKEMGEIQNVLDDYFKAKKEIEALKQNLENVDEGTYYKIEKIVRQLEIKKLFSGKWDKNSAIISIYAGAGGQDAADWVCMLYQMYEKYALNQGWKVNIIDSTEEEYQSKTGRKPLKNITFEVEGDYAFGYLKKESGVHRLVRISPFSPQSLRHTSFALVEVLPKIEERTLKIDEKDLKIEFFRSSGPGGQNVNKVETAVRIVHLPTGLVASSQVERSQSQNRERAMNILESKLIQLMNKERVDQLDKLKVKAKPEWGNQIRSYVLNPYQLIKDHRTEYETTKIKEVLEEGYLDDFIEAELVNENI
jgi:peptide chain release factor 2